MPHLLSLPPEKLALITIGTLYHVAARPKDEDQGPSILETAHGIAARCWEERTFDRARGRGINIQELLWHRNRSHYNASTRSLKLADIVDHENWEKNDIDLHLGVRLIQLAEETGIFTRKEIYHTKESKKGDIIRKRVIIEISPASVEKLARTETILQGILDTPSYRPMLIRPLPWTSLHGGGYLTSRDSLIPTRALVRHHSNPRILAKLETADMSTIFQAVNAIQNTPWRINCKIYRALEEASAQRAKLPWFPKRLIPLRSAPGKDAPEEERERYKYLTKENRKRASLAAKLRTIRDAAGELVLEVSEKPFYYPLYSDFRGRLYYFPPSLNPQGSDIEQGLLEFAEGKRLGENGRFWLAVYLANCYGNGVDRLAFAQRVDWVEKHHTQIGNLVREHLNPERYYVEEGRQPEKPWRFLAACYEWMEACQNGEAFESHLPIELDGSCNVFQHLAAGARDANAGQATNLRPSDVPQDLYGRIADNLRAVVQQDAEKGDTDASSVLRGLIDHLDRQLVKKVVMTIPYGVSPWRARKQIIEALEKKSGKLEIPWRSAYKGAKYIEDWIRNKCLHDMFPDCMDAIDTLRVIAGTLAKHGCSCAWLSPSGFPVVQEHRKAREHVISVLGSSLTVWRGWIEGTAIGRAEQSIVANFVHSLDAAHLHRVVARLAAEGLTSFCVRHDGYAVHACDVERLHQVLREEFVAMHCESAFHVFARQQQSQVPDADLAVTRLGRLDIHEVLKSRYFFG